MKRSVMDRHIRYDERNPNSGKLSASPKKCARSTCITGKKTVSARQNSYLQTMRYKTKFVALLPGASWIVEDNVASKANNDDNPISPIFAVLPHGSWNLTSLFMRRSGMVFEPSPSKERLQS